MIPTDPCPCDSGKSFQDCCQPFIEMQSDAPTAESLMRSRYSAFVLENEDYLRYSWHPQQCPDNIHLKDGTHWLGLTIINTSAGQETDIDGEVEFVARYKNNGRATRLHEVSRFIRLDARWVYLDGKNPAKKADKTR